MKRTIESALKLFRFCGSRPVFIVVFLTLFGLSVQGMLAGPWLVIVSTVAGVAFGAVQCLGIFAHIIEKHPQVIVATMKEWKADGRWLSLLQHLESQRANQPEN